MCSNICRLKNLLYSKVKWNKIEHNWNESHARCMSGNFVLLLTHLMNKYQNRPTNTTKRMNDPRHHELGRRRILRLGTSRFPKPISPEKTFIHPMTRKKDVLTRLVISGEWYRHKVFCKHLWHPFFFHKIMPSAILTKVMT